MSEGEMVKGRKNGRTKIIFSLVPASKGLEGGTMMEVNIGRKGGREEGRMKEKWKGAD